MSRPRITVNAQQLAYLSISGTDGAPIPSRSSRQMSRDEVCPGCHRAIGWAVWFPCCVRLIDNRLSVDEDFLEVQIAIAQHRTRAWHTTATSYVLVLVASARGSPGV